MAEEKEKKVMEITSTLIQKYAKYTTPQLRIKAGKKFRAFIRKRDQGQPCISCGSWKTFDASHYYSAGFNPEVEFNEDNCHLACASCNRFKGGNLHPYRVSLIHKIGIERVQLLETIVATFKKCSYKHDRINLIQIIEKYK